MDDPTDLTKSDYKAVLKRTLQQVKEDDVPSLAAGVAFRIFLSIFPSLLAAAAIFSIVVDPAELSEMLLALQTGVLPSEASETLVAPLLRDLASEDGSAAGFAAFAGVAAGLWAATSAAVALMKALSRAYDVRETRKFVKARLTAVLITLALVAGLAALVLLLVVGRQVQEAVLPGAIGGTALGFVATVLRLVAAVAVLVVLFAFVYWIGPNRERPSWVWISPGAIFGVVGWLVASGAFTLYAQTAGSYDKTYGTIAGVIVAMLWLQLTMLVLLVGAEFNAELERARALALAGEDGAGTGGDRPGASAFDLHTAEAAAAGATPTPAPTPPIRARAPRAADAPAGPGGAVRTGAKAAAATGFVMLARRLLGRGSD